MLGGIGTSGVETYGICRSATNGCHDGDDDVLLHRERTGVKGDAKNLFLGNYSSP